MNDISSIPGLLREINEIATNRGWRENRASEDRTGAWFATYIALVHSEVSEALEAQRDGVWYGTKKVRMDRYGGDLNEIKDRPTGVGLELAEAIIRIIDMADIWNIDIVHELKRALEWATERPYEPCPRMYFHQLEGSAS